MEGWETGEERGSGSSRPVGARARSRGLQERATSGRGHEREQPIGVSDLRPPTCGARLESGSGRTGRGESQGLGALSFSISP